jgi:hypothetical protein
MISKSINLLTASLLMLSLNACTETSGLASGGTSIDISAAPSPANIAAQSAGAKTFNNDLGDSITLTRAYLVLTNAEVKSSCGASFSVDAEDILNFLLPTAHAHTEATPTATGEPYVLDLLTADNNAIAIGSVSPPVDDYCGLSIDLIAADADTFNLPSASGAPNMVGKTVYIEGSYTQAPANGGNSGQILVSTGATLTKRDLALSPTVSISRSTPGANISVAIQYDTWFNAVDLAVLENETATGTSPLDPQVIQLMQNISASIHQR